jgi:hypothetical protein
MTLKGPNSWAHLRSLLDGYLHQDFTVEHGSAAEAVQAWLLGARREDAMEVSSEWRSFLNVTAGMDVESRARALRDLAGGAWAPADGHEFESVSALLRDAWWNVDAARRRT